MDLKIKKINGIAPYTKSDPNDLKISNKGLLLERGKQMLRMNGKKHAHA